MAARRRVAITGLGLVTPVGNDVASTWAALLAGKSGGAVISLFDASGFPVRIASEVKRFDAAEAIGERKLLKFANRSHGFALAAAEQALSDAGVRDRYSTTALEPVGNTPAQFAKVLRDDYEKFRRLARELNIRID